MKELNYIIILEYRRYQKGNLKDNNLGERGKKTKKKRK